MFKHSIIVVEDLKIGLSNKRLYNFQMIRFITFLFLVFISTFSIAQEIESGVIAIASNPVKITNAQGEVRIAKTGDKIYLNDTVQTDSQGKTQILLKDQMTISLGPNSQMVVDKFVYDPKEKSKNELSTQIKQGAFKFISGKIASDNKDAMKVSTPKATIAIRGTGVAGDIQPTGTDTIVLLDGQIGVTSNTDSKTTQTIAQSGFGVTVNPNGLVSQPAAVPATTLNTILNQLGPQSSSAGGTKEQQQIISALSADMLTGAGSVASKIGIENAVKLENALVAAANTVAKSSSDAVLVSDLFKIINQNNDLKNIVDSISTQNQSMPGYENITNVKVDVNLIPYFVAGPTTTMPGSGYFNKVGSVQFDFANIPMTVSNGGQGNGSGNVNQAQVVLNYDAKTFNTSYDVSYTLGSSSFQTTGNTTNNYSVTNTLANNGNANLNSSTSAADASNLLLVHQINGASALDLNFRVFSIGAITEKAGEINIKAYSYSSPTSTCASAANCVTSIGQSLGKPI